MTDEEMQEAVSRLMAKIEEARAEFARAGFAEPLASAVSSTLGGMVLAGDINTLKLRKHVAALEERLVALEEFALED